MDQDLLEYILAVSQRLAGTRTLIPLLNTVLDEAVELVGAERGYIVLIQPDGTLDFRAQYGQADKDPSLARQDQISRSILNQVVKTGQPLVLKDALGDSRFGQAESVVFLQLRSIMCVPLITRGETLGAIYVENRSIRGRFQDTDLPPLVVFANQAAVAIENATLIEQLETRVAERTKELEEARQQLEKSWNEAVESNRLRMEWLSTISHDLRAPLGITAASLSLIQEGQLGPLTPQQREWIDKSLQSIKHVTDLTDDIFNLSKIESGGLTLNRQNIDLPSFLNTVYEVGSGINWSPAVEFHLEMADDVWPVVSIDPVRIRQVLLNLISNACKFTHKGQVTLYARLKADQNQILLGVLDTGEGIPADKIGLLFKRFQQVDSNLERRKQGTGLGLAISREIVEMHGGKIWIDSTPNTGADVKFTLPLTSSTPLPHK
jgi:signal transduction histidine kinase